MDDLAQQSLDVYESDQGSWWNPQRGTVEIPNGWELLAPGDAFITREVKRSGPHWSAWRPRDRRHPYRRAIGVWAPKDAIDAARQRADETKDARVRQRAQGATYRGRQEERYRVELSEAIVDYLAFAPQHANVAASIASGAATRAAEVGSRRVGRTRKLTLEDRARLAARAHIRHEFTTYDDQLEQLALVGDDWLYQEAKTRAHDDVDEFLDRHR